MACLAISRCEAAPTTNERRREMATQTATPVKKTTSSVYAQTELARSPKYDGTLSTRGSSASFSPSSSSTSSFSEEPTTEQQEAPIHVINILDLLARLYFAISSFFILSNSLRNTPIWPFCIASTCGRRQRWSRRVSSSDGPMRSRKPCWPLSPAYGSKFGWDSKMSAAND